MKKSTVVDVAVAGGVLVLAGLAFYLAVMSEDSDPVAPPDVLLDLALNGATVQEREQATLDLTRSTSPDALPALRRVLDETRHPEVLACVIDGLGVKKDLDSMPRLTKLAQDESQPKRVRGRAGVAITRMIGGDFGWDVEKEQTPEQREKLSGMVELAEMMWQNKIAPH